MECAGFWNKILPERRALLHTFKDGPFAESSSLEQGWTGRTYARIMREARPVGMVDKKRTQTRRQRVAEQKHTQSETLEESSPRERIKLSKLISDSDVAIKRLLDHLKSSTLQLNELSESELQQLREVDTALHDTLADPRSISESPRDWTAPHESNTTNGRYSGNVNDYALTKERIQKVAAEQDGVVMVTWANFKYLDFVQNWLMHMKQIGVTTYMIGAMDKELLQALVEMGEENAFVMESALEAGDLSWGSPHFFAMGREKIMLIEKVTGLGVDVLVSDIDTVWLRDPFPYFARYPQADILASSDLLHSSTSTEALEREVGTANIGMLLFRKTALGFAQEWNHRLANDENMWDQNGFNELMIRNLSQVAVRPDHLFRGYNGSLWFGTLPVSAFANGHTYYSQDLSNMLNIMPYAIHNTFQFSGTPGKRHRFRERLLWLADPDEYFDPPGGLLSFDLDVEGLLEPCSHLDLTKAGLKDFAPHFQLVHHQLSQLRSAMAISSYLNRTLVLPQLWAGADRWWAPFHGVIPGSQNEKLPRKMPADHILDFEVWSKKEDVDILGPSIPFRESSFLNNSRLPADILDNQLRVHMCQEGNEACEESLYVYDDKSRALSVRSGLSDKEVVEIFQKHSNVKLLHFSDMRDVFGGFEEEHDARRFELRTRLYSSLFCCVQGHPGHVWYDMWWEFKDHVDRHGRTIDHWKPVLGP